MSTLPPTDPNPSSASDVSDASGAPPARRESTLRTIGRVLFIFVVLPALAYGIGVSLYEEALRWQQDRCAFGSVSNERYRDWLAKAKEMRRQQGVLIDDRVVEIVPRYHYERANNVRFDKLSQGVTSVDERIAIAHAMMRAEGFTLRRTWNTEGFEDLNTPHGQVGFLYNRFSWAGLLFSCTLGCSDAATINFYLKTRGSRPSPQSRDVANKFDIGFGSAPNPKGAPGASFGTIGTCPPVPSLSWTNKFLESLKR